MTPFRTNTTFTLVSLLLLSILLSSATCNSDDRPPRILVFSKTAGYRHASIPTGVAALRQICRENGMLLDSTENAADFNEKNLCRYAAVVFLSTTGDVLDPDQEAAFERYIQAGGGYVGIHAASDTEYGWGWYGELVGGYFENHPAIQEATLEVKNYEHPATKHLDAVWKRTDEWYNFRDLNPAVKVLLKIDETTYQGGTMGADHPMSWYHEFDGGRAFYTALGHTEESYSEPAFLQHLLGGLKYAIGDKRRLNYDLCRTPELPDHSRFVKTVLADNLYEPMELDMFPDGKIIFIERRGAIKLFNPNTGLVNIAYNLPVHDKHEDGLIGMALDPNWAENHWLYLYYSPIGDKPVNLLSRFQFAGDTLDRASEQVILEVPVQRDECCHAGGCVEFDAAGNLYLSTGDNTNPFASKGFAPIDEQPGRSAWDAQKSSANTGDLRGKILRIKPLPDGSYLCPAGNLFAEKDILIPPIDQRINPPGRRWEEAPEIYAMGCRNPFRLSLDNRRGFLFWGEVGPDSGEADSTRGPVGYDEVNRARAAGFFGWPYFVGNNFAYREYNFKTKTPGPSFDPERPQNNSPNNTGSQILPPAQPAFIWYPYGNSEEFPLLGNGSRNAMAGPVYYCDRYDSEKRFPDYYNGKLIIYDWTRNWMMAVTLDSAGNFSRLEPLASGVKLTRPMDMLVDKNGSLWVLEYGKKWYARNPDARLSRIDYIRGNRPPSPVLQADKVADAAPCTVHFSTAGTYDIDSDHLTYEIDFGDGSPVKTIASNKRVVHAGVEGQSPKIFTSLLDSVAHRYELAGKYEAKLKVTDSQGASAIAKLRIMVGNAPPQVFWDFNGKNRSFYEPWDTLTYRLEVQDREDGSLKNRGIDPGMVTTTIDYLETGFDMAEIVLGHQAAQQQTEFAHGKILIDRSDCGSCHATDHTVNGPAYRSIAQRYRNQTSALSDLSKKILLGGAGNWGQSSMSAHPQLSEDNAREMVRWILAIDEKPKPKQNFPPQGTYVFAIPKSETKAKKTSPGAFVLNATYQDRGSTTQAPLSGSESLVLRPAFQQAESADSMSAEVREFRPFKGDTVVLHELRHNSFFMFRHCDLQSIFSVAICLGSGYKNYRVEGGRIELRMDRPDGKLIGSVAVPAKNSDDQMIFSQTNLTIAQSAWPKDRSFHDLYFVFKNEKNSSRPVAVADWVRFNIL